MAAPASARARISPTTSSASAGHRSGERGRHPRAAHRPQAVGGAAGWTGHTRGLGLRRGRRAKQMILPAF
eukprot:5018728-Prymnesium_polylepis.2